MDTIKFENKKGIKMIAHRGANTFERENSCPAFVAAGVRTYYGIETDVHVTRDEKYIIHHDSNLMRLVGQDIVIEQSDFDGLRKFRMFDTDGVSTRGDLFLPSLDEYLSICRKYGKRAVLEFKERFEEKHIVGVTEAVAEAGMLDTTTFISFVPSNLILLKEHFPDYDIQLLAAEATQKVIDIVIENGFGADLHFAAINKELVELFHSHGSAVNAWTVDTLAEAERLAECGVDMITTNRLE